MKKEQKMTAFVVWQGTKLPAHVEGYLRDRPFTKVVHPRNPKLEGRRYIIPAAKLREWAEQVMRMLP